MSSAARSTVVVDRHGVSASTRREAATDFAARPSMPNDLPDALVHATMAAEDVRF